jgi:hypothetical protein
MTPYKPKTPHSFNLGDLVRFAAATLHRSRGLGLIKHVGVPKRGSVEYALSRTREADGHVYLVWFEGTQNVDRCLSDELALVSRSVQTVSIT